MMIALSGVLFAKDDTPSDSAKTYKLNPITVTATTTEVPANLVSPSISVISPEDIEAHPDQSIFSLISKNVPGVFITERDILGFGVNSSAGHISIRGIGGSPNNEVLTLIDGRPQSMGWYGHPVNDSYLATNIERVEVIRGPASMLYGSNAMGGVINIITHTNVQDGLAGSASASYGSNNTQQYGLHLGYQQNDWNFLGSFSHEHTDGARSWSEYNGNSGYLKSSCQLSPRYRVSVDGSYTQFNTYDPGQENNPYSDDWMHIRRGYAGALFEDDFGAAHGGIRFAYNFGHHELDSVENYGWVSDDHQIIATIYQSLNFFSNTTLTAGIDLQQNGGNAQNSQAGDMGSHTIEEYAGYMNVQQVFTGNLIANGGIRFVHNSYFGNIAIPQAGVTYTVCNGTNLRASVARGYRSPQLYELYQLKPSGSTLEPEELWNYEIGFSHLFGQRASIDIAGYAIDARQTIVDSWWPKTSWNTGGFHRNGIECSAVVMVSDNFRINTNYSFTDKPNLSQSVPKHKAYLGGEYRYRIVALSFDVQYVNTIYGTDNTSYTLKQLPDYTTADVRVTVEAYKNISLSIGSANIFNESYQTLYGYPMPGRTYSVGIRAGI